jgi:predicted RNase H-like HicB family nuclease
LDGDMGQQIVFVLTPDEDGGYVASAPGLPGCVTHGATIEQAIANAREAATVYLDGATADSLAAAGATLDVMVVTVEVPLAVPA